MTSVAAEQFHRESDPLVHFSPGWSGVAPCGANADDPYSSTGYVPWVTCPECKEFLQLDRSK